MPSATSPAKTKSRVGAARAPDHQALQLRFAGLDELAYQGRHDVGILQVKVVVRSIDVAWYSHNHRQAVLGPVGDRLDVQHPFGQ